MNRFIALRTMRVISMLRSTENAMSKSAPLTNIAMHQHFSAVAATKEEPISVSSPDGVDKVYDPKLLKIVDDISKLTLIEVSELNTLLKKTLNIADAPMMAPMMTGAMAAPQAEEEAEQAPVAVQSSFTLKLLKFDDSKKVALIKEVKNLMEGMNLVQAKKFVESAPTIIKADIAKDEAEKLQAAFQAVGATCEIV